MPSRADIASTAYVGLLQETMDRLRQDTATMRRRMKPLQLAHAMHGAEFDAAVEVIDSCLVAVDAAIGQPTMMFEIFKNASDTLANARAQYAAGMEMLTDVRLHNRVCAGCVMPSAAARVIKRTRCRTVAANRSLYAVKLMRASVKGGLDGDVIVQQLDAICK